MFKMHTLIIRVAKHPGDVGGAVRKNVIFAVFITAGIRLHTVRKIYTGRRMNLIICRTDITLKNLYSRIVFWIRMISHNFLISSVKEDTTLTQK